MTSSRTRRISSVVAVAALAATGAAFTGGSSSAAPNGPTMDIQLLSFNDFHGNLETPSGSSGRVVVGHKLDPVTGKAVDVTVEGAGGAEYLASHLKKAREGHPYSLTVAAGDIVGASPLLSAAFHDEPTIEAMNSLGLDATSVGNHEFDEGYKELQRLQAGGCIDDGDGANNQNSCADHTFAGADFPILAANVKYAGTDKTILAPYAIKNIKGAKIGFIGMTLKDTPNIVTQAGVAGLEFTDEVQTANALVPVLRAQGVNAIVVLVHQGGVPALEEWANEGKTYKVNPTYKWACQGGTFDKTLDAGASAPMLQIAQNLDPAIDMIVTGHTHQPYVCNVPDPKGQPRLVTSASSFGRLFTETDLTYDRRTQDIVRASVSGTNMIVDRSVPADPAQTNLINLYQRLITPIASKVIGSITTDITTTSSSAGESKLGDLIADAQLADPSVVTGGQTPVIAFMNPGGIRTNLNYATSKYGEAPGQVTFEEAFAVQPFNNYLVSMTLTGAQIKDLLNQQWSGINTQSSPKFLQISKGFGYHYVETLGTDGKVSSRTVDAVTLNGAPVVDTQSYRIVTNNFLSDGGDGFPAFKSGTGKFFGGLDIDAFASYLAPHSPYSPVTESRITKN
jgi:5'-nucleotidase